MNYYYFVASLPTLVLGQPPGIEPETFRQRCHECLSPGDAAVLEDVWAGGGTSAHPFARAWHDRDTRLRNAVARARAARLGRDVTPCLRPETGFDVYTARAVEEVFARQTPSEREFELDRFRWRVLDELVGPDTFSVGAVLAYGVKVRLAARWAALDPDAGRQAVEAIVESQAAAAPL